MLAILNQLSQKVGSSALWLFQCVPLCVVISR